MNERYHAELLLEASWEEASFKGLQTRPFDPQVNWTPELELINGIGELQDEIVYSVRYDKKGLAIVTEHHRLKGILWERMELQHFPVDVQELSLSITTSRTDSEMIFLGHREKPSGVNRRVFTDEQEWYLFEHVDFEITQQIDEFLDAGHNHPVVICSCHAARSVRSFLEDKISLQLSLSPTLENMDIFFGMPISSFSSSHPLVSQHFQFHYQSRNFMVQRSMNFILP